MTSYVEKTLHRPVSVRKYAALRKLPPVISDNYKLTSVTIDGRECIFAEPASGLTLSAVRKQQKQLEKLTGTICVLYLQKLNAYAKDRLIEEGIPFVVENKQIYLPFLGIALSDRDERVFKSCGQISFLTQRLLLTSIYEGWTDVSVSEAAEKLEVTKTSVTRCYDEIEAQGLPYIRKKSRARLFSAEKNPREMWENLKGILRNPVLREFFLKDDLNIKGILSGVSALSVYSMLNDNLYPTYAVSKQEVGKLLENRRQIYSLDETPGCIVQEVGYMISFGTGGAVDPLSVALMFTDSQMDDPRLSRAVDEMLEEAVWSRD